MNFAVRLGLAVGIAASTAAQQPTWQGRTLEEWLELGSERTSPAQLLRLPPDAVGAMAALGPGSEREADAMRFLAARLGNSQAVEALGAFGKAGLALLLEHRKEIRSDRAFMAGVVRSGKFGVPVLLAEMQKGTPAIRSRWRDTCRKARPEFLSALVGGLHGASLETAGYILTCLAAIPYPVDNAFEFVGPWILGPWAQRFEVNRAAVELLAHLRPEGLRPLLEELASGSCPRLRAPLLLAAISSRRRRPWTAKQKDFIPLLRACLRTQDHSPTRAAALLLKQIGPPAAAAQAELLAAARNKKFGLYTRGAAFAALWRIGPPSPEALATLKEVFANASDRGRALIEQCVRDLPDLEQTAVPYLRTALAVDRDQLRSTVLSTISRMGPAAKGLFGDLETMLRTGKNVFQVGKTIAEIAPERWPIVEPVLLALAKKEISTMPGKTGAAACLLVEHGRPRGEVLGLFSDMYSRRRWARCRQALQQHLIKGGELRPLVQAFTTGKLLLHDRRLVEALCSNADLEPAVPWLRTQLEGLESRVLASRKRRRSVRCTPPANSWWAQVIHARLLGAAGKEQLPFLRRLLASKVDVVQEAAYAGLGQMARSYWRARDLLIDRFFRLTGDVDGKAAADPKVQATRMKELQALTKGLSHGGPETARALAKQIREDTIFRNRAVMSALAAIGPDAAGELPRIVAFLEDEDAALAWTALKAARACVAAAPGDPKTLPELIKRLGAAKEPHPRLEIDVRRLLPSCAKQLLDGARRCHPEIRLWLLQLVATDHRTDPAWLVPFLEDPVPKVRMEALQGMHSRYRQRPDLHTAIARVAAHDPVWEIRNQAIRKLSDTGMTDELAKILRSCLDDRERTVRDHALWLLRGWK